MSQYTPIYEKPYPNGWKDLPTKETPVMAENLDAYDSAIENIENYLSENSIESGGGSNVDLTNLVVGNSISIGRKGNTSIGTYSSATGADVTANGYASHAEGNTTIASGSASHAEGYSANATNDYCHAEGYSTTANGYASHAEGYNTNANGSYSHAEGLYTSAKSTYQHVQGKYNIEDAQNKYAHIVGGGTSDSNRRNIHALDWEGNAEYAGTVKSAGFILTDAETGQDYVVTIANGNLEITAT